MMTATTSIRRRKQRTSTETIGTSDNFLYEDAKRLATYTTTGTARRTWSGRPAT